MGVRDKEARNGAPTPKFAIPLQQARGTKACNRISYQHGFPLKEQTGHRKPQCRIAEMKQFHRAPHLVKVRLHLGGDQSSGFKVATGHQSVNAPLVLWHSTKVIGRYPPNYSCYCLLTNASRVFPACW